MPITNRRQVLRSACALLGGAALAGAGSPVSPAHAEAKFTLRVGNISQVNHPLNAGLTEASQAIAKETNREVDLQIFPNSQLGSETDMLAQTRAGGLDFFAVSGITLSTLVPLAAINCVGFAFHNYDEVWRAMDGEVGKRVIAALGNAKLHAFDKMWDNGFRQIASSKKPILTPEDLSGFKLRVPPSTLWTAMFKALGAAPTPIPWGETYSALQTHVADGVENPLVGLYYANLFEVQSYLSMTNHMWDGYWFVSNARSWQALPAEVRDVIERQVNAAALRQREQVVRLNDGLRKDMTDKGMKFADPDTELFKKKLGGTAFYGDWKARFGNDAWASLEKVVGPLS